jgi:hypothetical protein
MRQIYIAKEGGELQISMKARMDETRDERKLLKLRLQEMFVDKIDKRNDL